MADVLCVIIHESDFKSVACLYLMAASATHEFVLGFSSSKGNDGRWTGGGQLKLQIIEQNFLKATKKF